MKKKSLMAMGLAGVMLVGSCVPVLAAEDSSVVDQDAQTTTVGATLDFTVTPTYSVTIPTKIEAGKKISFTNATGNLEDGGALKISISGGVDSGKIQMQRYKKDGTALSGEKVALVDINLGSAGVTASTLVAEYTTSENGLANKVVDELMVGEIPSGAKAGKYSGTVVFSVNYGNETSTPEA